MFHLLKYSYSKSMFEMFSPTLQAKLCHLKNSNVEKLVLLLLQSNSFFSPKMKKNICYL